MVISTPRVNAGKFNGTKQTCSLFLHKFLLSWLPVGENTHTIASFNLLYFNLPWLDASLTR
jgi:hypothetical protein